MLVVVVVVVMRDEVNGYEGGSGSIGVIREIGRKCASGGKVLGIIEFDRC